MNIDKMLAAICSDMKEELSKLLEKDWALCCSWCDNEVPVEIVGLTKRSAVRNTSGKIVETGKWSVTRGEASGESPGIVRDYTGWAKIRLSYTNPDEKRNMSRTSPVDDKGEPMPVEHRKLFICPACLDTSGLLTAKYYEQSENTTAKFVDPNPEMDQCEHGAERGKCLVCNKPTTSCAGRHYPGVICGDCGMCGLSKICDHHTDAMKGSCSFCKRKCIHGLYDARECCGHIGTDSF
jgi:hypothetical protein